jgi:hypothetical protein
MVYLQLLREYGAPGAFRLRPVCERETPNEWSLLAKPSLLLSSGSNSSVDGSRLRETKSGTSGNSEPGGDYLWSSAPARLSGSDASGFLDLTQ